MSRNEYKSKTDYLQSFLSQPSQKLAFERGRGAANSCYVYLNSYLNYKDYQYYNDWLDGYRLQAELNQQPSISSDSDSDIQEPNTSKPPVRS